MKKLPLSIDRYIIVTLSLFLIAASQVGIHSIMENETEIWQGNVTLTSWDYERWSDVIVMKVDCDGKEGRVRYGKNIAAYLQNPREPLYGTLYASGKVVLQAQEE